MFRAIGGHELRFPTATIKILADAKSYPITKIPTERRGRKTPQIIRGDIYQITYAGKEDKRSQPTETFSRFKERWTEQEGTPFLDRLIGMVEDNGLSIHYPSGLRSLRRKLEWAMLERRVRKAVTVSRSATLLNDSRNHELMLFYTNSYGIRHTDINDTVGEVYFQGVFGDMTRTLSSGHLADIQLKGAPRTTIFVSDRIDGKFFSDEELLLAKQLEMQGIILVSSDGRLIR